MKMYLYDREKDGDRREAFAATLPPKVKAAWDTLHPGRREEKLAGRMLLQEAADEAGLTNWHLRKGRYGKPYVWGKQGIPFFFNLSHSHHKAILLCDSRPVGVDMEYIRPISLEVSRKFATETEQAWIRAGDTEEERTRRFFLLWVLKEAWVKAEGKGLSLPMKSRAFTLTETGDGGYAVQSDPSPWAFTLWVTEDGYAVATAVRTEWTEQRGKTYA